MGTPLLRTLLRCWIKLKGGGGVFGEDRVYVTCHLPRLTNLLVRRTHTAKLDSKKSTE
jgi:hypothetical protein